MYMRRRRTTMMPFSKATAALASARYRKSIKIDVLVHSPHPYMNFRICMENGRGAAAAFACRLFPRFSVRDPNKALIYVYTNFLVFIFVCVCVCIVLFVLPFVWIEYWCNCVPNFDLPFGFVGNGKETKMTTPNMKRNTMKEEEIERVGFGTHKWRQVKREWNVYASVGSTHPNAAHCTQRPTDACEFIQIYTRTSCEAFSFPNVTATEQASEHAYLRD